ncbi:sensor histidine kinase [Streptomyces profundus]|uniref:sensor histidine kinase n=1 Tax=Streptomyces profundus TaxID=2867410 RepID=UPI002240E9F4|nr:histidine kinase [Streptomyces sp. MA3_2.13]UED86536.1 ATP-binding protein [Streptomyces sp. MA3_2.13]
MVSVWRRLLPEGPGRALGEDALLTAVIAAVSASVALLVEHDGRSMDGLGWALLAGSVLPLVLRRRAPLTVLLVVLAPVAVYHRLDYQHAAPFVATAVAAYTVAAVGPRWRTLLLGAVVLLVVLVVWRGNGGGPALKLLRISGWMLCVIAVGEVTRLHRRLLAAARERAERAERDREEEAARRVAEERLRVARDLHDLLAHSITVIGVRASVASHLLTTAPERQDRPTLVATLDGIHEVCQDARAELRDTLRVLRGDEDEPPGPLPGVDGIPDLVRAAEESGALVELTLPPDAGPLPGLVSSAAYRVTQEALTNAVRHAGPGVRIRVRLAREAGALRLTVADEGPPPGAARPASPGGAGLGLAGMRERVRGVGGTLTAGPGPGGFAVTAELPLPSEART